MTYEDYRKDIVEESGDFFSIAVAAFLAQATDFAVAKQYEDSLTLANDALVMAKYSDIGYDIIYLLSTLSLAYLQNHQPEMAEKYFNYAMLVLDKNDSEYDKALNQLLEIKALIEKELQKKNEAK